MPFVRCPPAVSGIPRPGPDCPRPGPAVAYTGATILLLPVPPSRPVRALGLGSGLSDTDNRPYDRGRSTGPRRLLKERHYGDGGEDVARVRAGDAGLPH